MCKITAMDNDTNAEKASYLNAFQDALLMEERLLVQKAKIDWLKLGDANTAYFHKVVKSAIGFYYLFCNRLSEDAAVSMIRDVTDKEIRDAMFSLGDTKRAPGAKGNDPAAFYKEDLGALLNDSSDKVPLVPSWLLYRDCSELMERIKSRISDWKNKTLSFAGRAQLIRFERLFLCDKYCSSSRGKVKSLRVSGLLLPQMKEALVHRD
ncbi:hypothetical protein Tco_0058916 [Tanacetum coccineum]